MFLSATPMATAATFRVTFESEPSSSRESHTDSKICSAVNSVFRSIGAFFKALKEGICSLAQRIFSRQSNSPSSALVSPLLSSSSSSKGESPTTRVDDDNRSFGRVSVLSDEEPTRDVFEKVNGQSEPMKITADKFTSWLAGMRDDLFEDDLYRTGSFIVDRKTMNGKTDGHIQELSKLIGENYPDQANQKYVKMLFTQNAGTLIHNGVNQLVEDSEVSLKTILQSVTNDLEYNSENQQVTWTNYFVERDMKTGQYQPLAEGFKTTTTFSCDSTKGAVIQFEEMSEEDCAKVNRIMNEEIE